MQLLNKLSEFLHKFVSLLFLKKIVVLRASSYSDAVSNFKHLEGRCFLGNLQMFRRVLLVTTSEINPNISWTLKRCYLHLSIVLFSNVLFYLETYYSKCFNTTRCIAKKKPCVKISFYYFLLQLYNRFSFCFGGALRKEPYKSLSRRTKAFDSSFFIHVLLKNGVKLVKKFETQYP